MLIQSARRCTQLTIDLREPIAEPLGTLALGLVAERLGAVERLIGGTMSLPPEEWRECAHVVVKLHPEPLPDDLMRRSNRLPATHRARTSVSAHTVSRPIHATLPGVHALQEIEQSRHVQRGEAALLFAHLSSRRAEDDPAESSPIVRKLGLDYAGPTAWGSSCRGIIPFQGPRFPPWDRFVGRFALLVAQNLSCSRP